MNEQTISEHVAQVSWQRKGEFSHLGYDESHQAQISGISIPMSTANTPDYIDPEQALAASLASCHMLTFLALAAKKRLVVESYDVQSTAYVSLNEQGKTFVDTIKIKPEVVFSKDSDVSREQLEKMHHKAHSHCFIANSLLSEVVMEIPAD